MIKTMTAAAATAALMLTGLTACAELDEVEASADSSAGQDAGGAADPEAKPKYTKAQEQAIGSAESYLDMSGFSKQGLIEQLSSDAGDGFPRKVAVFAVNHIKVSWKEQAVRSAQDYLDMSSFSKQGLIDQLSSSAGDQYTREQAEYAVNKVYK